MPSVDYQAKLREIEERRAAEAAKERERLDSLRHQLPGNGGNYVPPQFPVHTEPVKSEQPVVEQPVQAEPIHVEETHVDDVSKVSTVESVEKEPVLNVDNRSESDEPDASEYRSDEPSEPIEPVHPKADKPVEKQASKKASAASKARQKSKGDSVLTSDPIETKQIRAVYNIAAEIATREFPGVSIGDAVSAYIIAHSEYRPNVPAELRELIDGYQESTVLNDISEQNQSIDARLTRLENTVKILASGMQELELGIAYLIADRKGLTRESANATLGGKGINMLEDVVPQTMDRMHEQTKQYLNMRRLQEGRRTTPPK